MVQMISVLILAAASSVLGGVVPDPYFSKGGKGTVTVTNTVTATETDTVTNTVTATETDTITNTVTATETDTITNTVTATETDTVTVTVTKGHGKGHHKYPHYYAAPTVTGDAWNRS